MAFGSDARARQTFPAAAPHRGAAPLLEPVQPCRVRRNRPVAILKIPRFWTATQFGRPAGPAEVVIAPSRDGLDAFGSETDPSGEPRSATATGRPKTPSPAVWVPTAARWATVILLSAGLALALMYGYQHRFGRTAATGTVTLETTPSALDVVMAGKTLGKTPLTTSLAPGTYDVQIGAAPYAKTIKLVVAAGTSTVQRVEFAGDTPLAGGPTGGLRIQTEPSHLPVMVDGTAHGASPVAIDKLQPGEHEVSVRTSTGTVRRTVSIQPRETVSLIVSTAPAPPADASAVSAGWISVSSPVPLQLREGGKVIGTSESDRLMLTAGDHDIEFVNQALGFSGKRTVRVTAGKTATTKVELPNGIVSINAQPWAEVWIDGERIGETPIGNLSRRVGTHEVLFKHPELGERRESVLIVVGKPARIGVDLRRK
jgi:PEGA domain-containing protein